MYKKIIGICVCMLMISSAVPVVGLHNQNNDLDNDMKIEEDYKYSSTGTEEDWWEMFRHDAGNTGSSTCEGPDTNDLCWQESTFDEISIATPVIVDEKLYISTGWLYNLEPPELLNIKRNQPNKKTSPFSKIMEIKKLSTKQYYGSIYCFHAVSGTLLWDFFIGFGQDPAVVDGKIYIPASGFYYNSYVHCRDAETGQTEIWKRQVNGLMLSSVIVYENKVYVGTLDYTSYSGKLYCLDAENGNIKWTYTMNPYEIMFFSSAAADNGLVYFIATSLYGYYGGSTLYCLNAETGEFKWSKPIGYTELCSPSVADGMVYVNCVDLSSFEGALKCFNAITGSEIWEFKMGSYQYALCTPAIYEDSVYDAGLSDYSSNGRVYRINASTGIKIWDKPTSGMPYYSSPSVADDKIYLTVSDYYGYSGKLICLDVDDGDIIWDYSLGSLTMSSAAVASGRVYTADYFGDIYAIGYPNDPPDKPEITGDSEGRAGKEYEYTFTSNEPDGENVSFFVYWGDGNATGWFGPYPSGEAAVVSHTWEEKGTYNITARAKDPHGAMSEWGKLDVTMPAHITPGSSIITLIFNILKQISPILEKIFYHINEIISFRRM